MPPNGVSAADLEAFVVATRATTAPPHVTAADVETFLARWGGYRSVNPRDMPLLVADPADAALTDDEREYQAECEAIFRGRSDGEDTPC